MKNTRAWLLSLFLCLAATTAQAQGAQDAQAAFVERQGLLDVDARCHLLSPGVRAALQTSASQTRNALLSNGWTRARFEELQQATHAAARARSCDDPRNATAVASARAGYDAWARLSSMTFAGWERNWIALRLPGRDGWRLRQDTAGQAPAVFGVRERGGAQALTLLVWLSNDETAPASARLALRDPARARISLLDVPGRIATGLEAGAPTPATARYFLAGHRNAETSAQGQRGVSFIFPDAAFEAMSALDPRESAEIRLGDGPHARRILFEIGDLAAARAFAATTNANP